MVSEITNRSECVAFKVIEVCHDTVDRLVTLNFTLMWVVIHGV